MNIYNMIKLYIFSEISNPVETLKLIGQHKIMFIIKFFFIYPLPFYLAKLPMQSSYGNDNESHYKLPPHSQVTLTWLPAYLKPISTRPTLGEGQNGKRSMACSGPVR